MKEKQGGKRDVKGGGLTFCDEGGRGEMGVINLPKSLDVIYG